jgi:hypothetical protein
VALDAQGVDEVRQLALASDLLASARTPVGQPVPLRGVTPIV